MSSLDNKLIGKVQDFILKNNIIRLDDKPTKIIVGLSGGPDSVFLISILQQLKSILNLELIAAHLDHEWRNGSSFDVQFCRDLSEKLSIKFVHEKASNIKLVKRVTSNSKEELGRFLRRQFLEAVLYEHKAEFIALGHNFDDQIETFLIRLIRGSSIAGLSCIKMVNNFYIRPMLDIKKVEILDYLNANKLSYLKDSTNEQDLYLRNRIRKYIVPQLRFCDDRFDLNFKKTILNLQNTESFVDHLAQDLLRQVTVASERPFFLYLDKKQFLLLEKNYSHIYHKIILLWLCYHKVEFVPSTGFFNEILKFIKNSRSKSHMVHNKWYLLREKNYIKIVNVDDKI